MNGKNLVNQEWESHLGGTPAGNCRDGAVRKNRHVLDQSNLSRGIVFSLSSYLMHPEKQTWADLIKAKLQTYQHWLDRDSLILLLRYSHSVIPMEGLIPYTRPCLVGHNQTKELAQNSCGIWCRFRLSASSCQITKFQNQIWVTYCNKENVPNEQENVGCILKTCAIILLSFTVQYSMPTGITSFTTVLPL